MGVWLCIVRSADSQVRRSLHHLSQFVTTHYHLFVNYLPTAIWYPTTDAAKADLSPVDAVHSDHFAITASRVYSGYFVPVFAFIPSMLAITTPICSNVGSSGTRIGGAQNESIILADENSMVRPVQSTKLEEWHRSDVSYRILCRIST